MKKLILILVALFLPAFLHHVKAQIPSSDQNVRASEEKVLVLISFTAIQENNKIVLRWQPDREQNDRGFEVQRKLPNNDFKTIAYLPLKAVTGKYDPLVNYCYEDRDDLESYGELYYRIRKMNPDGSISFSDTRMVKNDLKKINVHIYPNPSNGMVFVVLPNGIKPVDIILNDFSGKKIKRWDKVTDRLEIDKLIPGVYYLRILNRDSEAIQVHQIHIN